MKKYIVLALGSIILGAVSLVSAQGLTFVNDLTVGSSNPEVALLQNFLISQGFSIPAISAHITAPGYFGLQTKAAVQQYQAANGIPSTGYVGPMTRARLNGGDYRGQSLRVTSPNGGEVLSKGSMFNITWTGAQGLLNQTGSIWLQYYTPPCAEPTNPVRCMIAVQAPALIADNVSLASQSYSWQAGIVKTPNTYTSSSGSYVTPPPTVTVPDGQYRIRLCPTNSNACDTSDNYFQITSGVVTSNAPVINGIDAPTTLAVGQTGTWNVRAIDPYNGTLSYSVRWGDEASYMMAPMSGAASFPAYSQSASFTHSYSQAGTYTVTFYVRNASGQTAQSSATVTVTGSSTVGPLNIIVPNGGESLRRGDNYTIQWTSPQYFRATYVDLRLAPYLPCNPVCNMMAMRPYTIATGISANQNSYTWNVGTNIDDTGTGQIRTIPDGQYKIELCETNTSNCDTSDSPFTISSSVSTDVPDINIISPNGGETWYVGANNSVTVNITGAADKIGNLVTVSIVDSSNQQIQLSEYPVTAKGMQTIPIVVPAAVPPGSYRVLVNLFQTGVTCQAIGCPPAPRTQQAYDYSDGYITVGVGSTYYPYPMATCPMGYVCTPQTY